MPIKAQHSVFIAAQSQSPELLAEESHDIQGDAFMHVAYVHPALPIFRDVIAPGGGGCTDVKSSACSQHRNMDIFVR